MTDWCPPLTPPQGKTCVWAIDTIDGAAWAIRQAYRACPAPLLLITPDVTTTHILRDALAVFLPGVLIEIFPDWEMLPYDHFSPHQDILSERIRMLRDLPTQKEGIVLVSMGTLLHRLAPPAWMVHAVPTVKVGDTWHTESKIAEWTACGYRRVSQVRLPGEIAIRGDICDVFPTGCPRPVRMELLGDTIESIRWFDAESQRSAESVEEIAQIAAREFPTDANGIRTFRHGWRSHFEGQPANCPLYQSVSEGQFPPGIEYYIPLFFEEMATLFEYIPSYRTVITVGPVYQAAETFWKEVEEQYHQWSHDLLRPLLKPISLFLTVEQAFQKIHQVRKIEIQTIPHKNGSESLPIAALPDLTIDSRHTYPLQRLESYHLQYPQDRILFFVDTPGRQSVLQETLRPYCGTLHFCEDWEAFENSTALYNVTIGRLQSGFRFVEGPWTAIPESVLFGYALPQRRRRDAKSVDSPQSSAFHHVFELQPGTAVVHYHYGVGRYQGLTHLAIGAVETDYLVLEYAGEDKIYLPVSALHLLHRYTGSQSDHVPLHKLGTDQWEKAQHEAAEKARDVAIELLEIYARRSASCGEPLQADHEYQRFSNEFPFEETPDQQTAITATLEDLKKSTPMDRLICGDVGFGKTEVAMRAAFVAIQSGKQVALLVPTTLLAQQHYENFRDRFAQWPIRLAVLSRFETSKATLATLEGLANGTIDMVIGTHKLIHADMNFHALGLIIIDEEHRFGVRQKEALRALRAQVHVLALTATPIPRTLNMALSGIRDMSIIATPPARRLSIKTFIRPYQESLIREAIIRESMRGGQVYYLHNDTQTMQATVDTLHRLVPEVSIAMAHGQMPTRVLEHIMSDFYHQRFQVLVCTTIIETGIDIPSANTIIIERADKFGLAQLHQLRGRVGRSHHQAYAYCLIPTTGALRADATKRMEAFSTLEDLGAGFHVAIHDMEIRGAGEFLGEAQSGNIQSVGYDLYMKLLQRAVHALQKGTAADMTAPLYVGAEIDLQVGAFIPERYVPDIEMRLSLYRRISDAPMENLGALRLELRDRFGPIPEPVIYLFQIMELKHQAQNLGIDKIEAGPSQGYVRFGENPPIHWEALIQLIQKHPRQYQLKRQNQLHFQFAMPDIDQRCQRLMQLFSVLSTPS